MHNLRHEENSISLGGCWKQNILKQCYNYSRQRFSESQTTYGCDWFRLRFAMESLFKNLKEQVTCSICLDTYTKPKTIACLHTFCCDCLKKHALASQWQGKFRCPECQTELDIPEGDRFDNLPTSFLHNSFLSLLAVRQIGDGRQISSCNICQKSSAEISYCFDCEKMLCRECVIAHGAFQAAAAAFEGHKVRLVKQF